MPYRPGRAFARQHKKVFSKYSKGLQSYAGMATANLKAIKQLRAQLNVEYKHFDVINTTAPVSTGAIIPLTNIIQGDGQSSRDGRSLKAKSLLLRATFTEHASATNTIVRMILVRDSNNSVASSPAVTDVLEGVDVNDLPKIAVQSQYRFKILSDQTLLMASSGTSLHRYKKYFKMDHKVLYDSTTADSASKGSLWMIVLCNEATNTPTMDFRSRLRYIDN